MLDFRVNTFLCVCRTMNYTKAAEELHVTQPAVSSHIRFLEEHYHIRLFIYHHKKLYLTPEGEILRDRLRALQNDEILLKEELQTPGSGLKEFSLGVTMTVGEYAIIEPLSRYLNRHPDINIRLHFGNTAQLLQMLENGQISLALVEGYYPKTIYAHQKYSTEDFIAVCAASHTFQNGNPSRLGDLLGERLLVREDGSGTRNILARSLSSRGIRIEDFPRYMQVENMHTIIGLLKEDCGISFLYKIAADEELRGGTLREIHLNDFTMQHDFDFIWEKGSIYTGRYESICEELTREYQKRGMLDSAEQNGI